MKDKLKDIVPPTVNGLNREISRIVSEVKDEFIKYFNIQSNINNETASEIRLLNEKIDITNRKLDSLNNSVLLDSITEKLDKLNKLDELDDVIKKLDTLKMVDEKLDKFEEIISKLDDLDKLDQIIDSLSNLDKLDQINEKLDGLKKLEDVNKKLDKLNKLEEIYSKLESNGASLDILNNLQNNIKINVNQNKNTSEETLWSNSFFGSIENEKWVINKAFSYGKSSIGYTALYVIFKVLNEFKPTNILEFGLGEQTNLISQYVSYNNDIEHNIIEHDLDWVDFFTKSNPIGTKSHLVKLETEMVTYKKSDKVQIFTDFAGMFTDSKFDFIVIDSPASSDIKQYSRIDILNLLPSCLKPNFVILIDDYHRIGEQNTVKDIEIILSNNNIGYQKGVYSGKKDLILITSNNLKFLTML